MLHPTYEQVPALTFTVSAGILLEIPCVGTHHWGRRGVTASGVVSQYALRTICEA